MIPVVLCGGLGMRMWPLSRQDCPKQFLPLMGQHSLLQDTFMRLPDFIDCQNSIVVCNQHYQFTLTEQLAKIHIQPQAILLEPVSRNTAPAITLAALACPDPEAILLILPADHVIGDRQAFSDALAQAHSLAQTGALVAFGVKPTHPEIGYGYIQKHPDSNQIIRFVEKPILQDAKSYLNKKNHYWNSGMFACQAKHWLQAMQTFRPDILTACKKASRQTHNLPIVAIDAVFADCPSQSIDHAVMENTDQALVVPLNAKWSDVGSWATLWEITNKDAHGNHLQGDVLAIDSKNCYLQANHRLLGTVGLNNTIVIETPDAVLVADKNQVQQVKAITEQLKSTQREEVTKHRKVYRPWGWYDCIDNGPRHQVKHILVNPGSRLSLQMHHRRCEHWTIISGRAKVTVGDEEIVLVENQSTYIPVKTKHRLENIGTTPLEIIEVQIGDYLGEDDIVRYCDDYGREVS